MGSLKDCLKLHPGLRDIEIQKMTDKLKKRTDNGESVTEASRAVLKEFQGKIDEDMDVLRKQLKIKGPTPDQRTISRNIVKINETKAIREDFEKKIEKIDNDIAELYPKAKKGELIKLTLAGREVTEQVISVTSNGDVIIDHFGLKTIKRGDYEIVIDDLPFKASSVMEPIQGKADVKKGDRIQPQGIQKTDKKGRVVRPKTIIQIFGDLQKNLNKLTKSIGNLKYSKTPAKGAIGAFSPFYRTIAMKSVGDLDTTAHELAHAFDKAYGLRASIPDNKYGAIHNELVPAFSQHGSTPDPSHPDPASYILGEGIAEWTRAYVVNPKEAIAAAPQFYEWYQSVLPKEAHATMEAFAEDVRILGGASGFDIINASVEVVADESFAARAEKTKNELLEGLKPQSRNPHDFKVTWMDKIKQSMVDSMHPWDATVRFAAMVGNIEIDKVLPSWNPLIMARLFLGRNSKIQNFLEKGFVYFNTNKRVMDPKFEKLIKDVQAMRAEVEANQELKPREKKKQLKEFDKAIAHLEKKGTVSLPWLLEAFDNSDRVTFDSEQSMMVAYGIALRTQEQPLKYVEKQIYAALEKGQIIPSRVLYSNKRFYDKFNDWNESNRENIYSENEAWNENLKDEAKKQEAKINQKHNDNKAKLEKTRNAQQLDFEKQRQKSYDQKGKIDEKKRISKLRIFEQESTEAQQAFEKAIDGIELERFKAMQRLQARIDDQMDGILKATSIASIKAPRGIRFTGVGGNIVAEQVVAQKTIDELEAMPKEKQVRIKEGLRRYRLMSDTILKYLVASSRISEESYKRIKKDNLEYIMLQRVLESKPGEKLDLDAAMPVSSKGVASVKEVLHGIKGSSAIIKNPYEALLKFAHAAVVEADRNYVLKSYVDFMKIAIKGAGDNAGRITKIIAPAVKGDKNTIRVFVGGQELYYQVDEYIYKSMKGIVDQLYVMPWWATAMPKLLRASVTNNPVFAARNLLRDYQTMLVVSNNVRGIGDFIPRKLQKIGDLEPKDAYDVFGAGQGGYQLLSENFYNQTMKDTAAKLAGTKGNILVKAADLAKLAGRSFGELSGASEKVTRMQEFKNSFRKAKKKGLDDYNAGLKAAFDSRSLMDFAVVGEWMNVINQLIPFTNAKIQGVRVAKRGFAKNPAAFALKAGITVMLPQFLIRAMLSREEDERYRQLPEYQRNMYWNIPTGNGWLMIPKPHDIAVISTMADMFYDYSMGNDVDYSGFNQALFAIMPMSRSDMAGPGKVFVELIANKDFFRDKTIAYDDERAMEGRNYAMASRIGKFIGEPIGVDPRKVDHFIKGTLAYFGNQAMRLSDMGREDKKRNLADMTGFYKEEPVYSYKDVQWAQEQAKLYNLETEEYYMVLRWMLQEYSFIENDAGKKQMAIAVRDYSGYLKDLWKSYGIHEEAYGAYRKEFKDAVKKDAESLTNSQFVKDLKQSRKDRKESTGNR